MFQKGNRLAASNNGISPKQNAWDNFGEWMLSDATANYRKFVDLLAAGTKLSAPKLEFMTRYERQQEFFKPKRARVEHVGDGGGPMQVLGFNYVLPNDSDPAPNFEATRSLD